MLDQLRTHSCETCSLSLRQLNAHARMVNRAVGQTDRPWILCGKREKSAPSMQQRLYQDQPSMQQRAYARTSQACSSASARTSQACLHTATTVCALVLHLSRPPHIHASTTQGPHTGDACVESRVFGAPAS
mmetsp:Transcript_7081/g.19024  ORF Transcript_7081/g.19024 Transcript_7081/m.19024 type:complete len:131 (-) Transcript_7081:3862-4254(-)